MSTTKAGSGHPTSSLSAVELMTTLLFGGLFRFDVRNPGYCNNDRLIFSKGHAAPLLYALWLAAGRLSEKKLLTLRQFTSPLEGHPTPRFAYTEAATGSLGQGLSVGVGMALAAKYILKLSYKTFVLLGDSEMAEGAVWEAMQIAAHYKLDNLVGIIDVNRLGQRGETMYGHNIDAYQKRVSSFGWHVVPVDGHDVHKISTAYRRAFRVKGRPVMVIAKTIKGKGVSFLEDKEGWHGKPLSSEELKKALKELGDVNTKLRGTVTEPQQMLMKLPKARPVKKLAMKPNTMIATRRAYGEVLVRMFPRYPTMVVLDGEVSNSTYAELFKQKYQRHFFEMYIAEQNMAGVALGMCRRGLKPFVSSFAAFLTRAFDQIRMASYSNPQIVFCGSHAGVSIGADGPSQMGLEDIALFRSIHRSTVLYPADAVATHKLVEQAAKCRGIVYLRTTRSETPVIYKPGTTFPIGGCKILKQSARDVATVAVAGITVQEALKAYQALARKQVNIRVIDLYSIKPIDAKTLRKAARETGIIIIAEDSYPEGGIAEAVRSALGNQRCRIVSYAVRKMPRSGSPQELLDFEGISAKAIVESIERLIGK